MGKVKSKSITINFYSCHLISSFHLFVRPLVLGLCKSQCCQPLCVVELVASMQSAGLTNFFRLRWYQPFISEEGPLWHVSVRWHAETENILKNQSRTYKWSLFYLILFSFFPVLSSSHPYLSRRPYPYQGHLFVAWPCSSIAITPP